MQMLKFRVQGSAKEPYTVTAEGEGETFRMFCDCPAGRQGGKFCKHAAALLVGDVTKLIGASDDIMALAKMAEGSLLVEKALVHRPAIKDDRWQHLESLEDVVREFGDRFAAKGYYCEIVKEPGELPHTLPREELRLYAHFKNGKRRKTPSHVLYYERLGGDAIWEPDAEEPIYQNVAKRARPWGYDGKTMSTLSKLIPAFLEGAGLR